MSVIWNFLEDIYINIDNFIREEIPLPFFVAVAFLFLWAVILGILGIIIFLSIGNWKVGAWIFGIIIGFEILHVLGEKLMKDDFSFS